MVVICPFYILFMLYYIILYILCPRSVGYGDMTPTTPAGRALAVCIQLSINLILTLPIG